MLDHNSVMLLNQHLQQLDGMMLAMWKQKLVEQRRSIYELVNKLSTLDVFTTSSAVGFASLWHNVNDKTSLLTAIQSSVNKFKQNSSTDRVNVLFRFSTDSNKKQITDSPFFKGDFDIALNDWKEV